MDGVDDSMEDDSARRQREINTFAAMAAGGTFMDDPDIGQEAKRKQPSAPKPSGTFAARPRTGSDPSEKTAHSNLDAAAAALAFDQNEKVALSPSNMDFPEHMPNLAARRAAVPIPMYSERVFMPRPLFFGPIVPPRVLQGARKIVGDAAKELGLAEGEIPRLSDLPPEVRNLVGAIETYGYGLSALMTGSEEPKGEFWRGDAYVSSYHPVWGEAARQERERLRTKDKPAPPPPSPPPFQKPKTPRATPAAGERSQENDSPMTDAGQQTSGEASEIGGTPQVSNKRLDKKTRPAASPSRKSVASPSRKSVATEPIVAASNKANEKPAVMTDANLFSQWAQGGGGMDSPAGSQKDLKSAKDDTLASRKEEQSPIVQEGDSTLPSPSSAPESPPSAASEGDVVDRNLFSKWAGGDVSSPTLSSLSMIDETEELHSEEPPKGPTRVDSPVSGTQDMPEQASEPLSEQQMFAKWALGEEKEEAPAAQMISPDRPFDTFQQIKSPENRDDDSDDDSVVGSELKKKVGINEHLDAAVASLANDNTASRPGGSHQPSESITAEEANALLSQACATAESGRPISNFELTSGCVPLFACDDGSLPNEADLELFQTRDEQLRHLESCRSEEFISKHTLPNLFGTVACPNPALDPEDNHRWKSRTASPRTPPELHVFTGGMAGGPAILPVLASPTEPAVRKHAVGEQSPSTVAGSVASDMDDLGGGRSVHSTTSNRTGRKKEKRRAKTKATPQGSGHVYGWWNVPGEGGSRTSPGRPERNELTPLLLPPLGLPSSDMQVKTRLSPSPEKLREENRPLSNMHAAFRTEQMLPFLSDRPPSYRYIQIDTQVVGFPAVEEIEPLYCSLSVYHVEPLPGDKPRAVPMPNLQRCGRITEVLNFDVVTDPKVQSRCARGLWPYRNGVSGGEEQTQGTRCGVFPLPSNFNIVNLYAILVVHKVVSEEADLDPYLKENKAVGYDAEKLRAKAEKASARRGRFLVPFCFGVAPLIQVVGTDTPNVARSRAVQIPLFHLATGQGDRPIIDHIMVMLNPVGELSPVGSGGRAANSNGGTAFFVMRNFGYLGLHSAVYGKSTLARDRLVDFSGEIQIRRDPRVPKGDDDVDTEIAIDGMHYVVPPWRSQIIAEPAEHGGRALSDRHQKDQPKHYAQELAPVPLLVTPSFTGSVLSRDHRFSGGDIEPLFRTCFCNELLCYPRILNKGPKGCIAIKTELRQLEWNEVHQSYLAHIPWIGPSLHNPRRGPFLVQDAYTSCAVQTPSPHFLDEFKFKLPLILHTGVSPSGRGRSMYALMFTVCHVHLKPRRNWKFGKREEDEEKRSKVDVLACGFLPITTSSDSGCLIDNGLHNVKMAYSCRSLPPELADGHEGSMILKKLPEPRKPTDVVPTKSALTKSDEGDGSEKNGSETQLLDTDDYAESSVLESESAASDTYTDSEQGLHPKLVNATDLMNLQVRIVVHSSVHPQSATLSEFFRFEPDAPAALGTSEGDSLSPLKATRSSLLSHLRSLKALSENEPLSDAYQKLHLYTVDVSKSALCSQAERTSHFFRLVRQLLKILLAGDGKSSLVWADPGSHVSLRVQAFASLLQILYSVNTFMMKNGTRQLDMKSRWSMTALGRILAIAIDENLLMGVDGSLEEVYDAGKWLSRLKQPSAKPAPVLTNTTPVKRPPPISQRAKTAPPPSAMNDSSASLSFSDFLADLKADFASTDESLGLRNKSATLPGALERSPLIEPETNPVRYAEFKMDSKADFQSALRAGNVETSDSPSEELKTSSTDAPTSDWGSFVPNRRRFNTAPVSALATIREDSQQDLLDLSSEDLGGFLDSPSPGSSPKGTSTEDFGLDSEIFRRSTTTSTVKKMRVPTIRKEAGEGSGEISKSPPGNDEIVSAGSSFLDDVMSSPSSSLRSQTSNGKQRHRRTRSQTSCDWASSDLDAISSSRFDDDTLSPTATLDSKHPLLGGFHQKDLSMSALTEEAKNMADLPSFVDRLALLGKTNKKGRWVPYLYEVIIFQWVALLEEQRKSGEQSYDRSPGDFSTYSSEMSQKTADCLSDAAMRARGSTIACAPILFELIKQSIGYRIESLFQNVTRDSADPSVRLAPIARLDDSLLVSLEHLVCMVTDACLDVRSFDSHEFRRTSVEVNDSIIRFLVDLFGMLETKSVQRLLLVYLSRFVVRHGKLWQDRDSKIGLKCSYEVAKLRMNAVTALVRFPDFVRVNSPQLAVWSDGLAVLPSDLPRDAYDNILEQFMSLGIPGFSTNDGPISKSNLPLPPMQPHWLAELVTDICLSGTDHAEQSFQQRASSLLYELFWSLSQDAQAMGASGMVASMFVPFLFKILWHVSYLSALPPKSQLRKDILPCSLYVLQSAPGGLLRAVWRKLLPGVEGKGVNPKYGGVEDIRASVPPDGSVPPEQKFLPTMYDDRNSPDILDMFALLNLSLATFEYDGSEKQVGSELDSDSSSLVDSWKKEFLPALDRPYVSQSFSSRLNPKNADSPIEYSSTVSRRWHAHDVTTVVINTCRQIVREMLSVSSAGSLNYSFEDTVVFVRAATSVCLHALTLRESDVATVKVLNQAMEILTIFGIDIFLSALGDTLQHWMRVVSMHCGARRQIVRIAASDFLGHLLRRTWDGLGSLSRIRVPLLAVQSEVMERIVLTATARYYREQRQAGTTIQYMTNDSAEASLSPLWRTLDRLHHQSATHNSAFKSAVMRLAEKLKILYCAYIAAHAFNLIERAHDSNSPNSAMVQDTDVSERNEYAQNRRVIVHRIVSNSAGYTRYFLGLNQSGLKLPEVAHFEAIEDAFLDAAHVFSSTELPQFRVAWFRRLAKFHTIRSKFAEEAMCRHNVYLALSKAAAVYHSLWSHVPFVPWTDDTKEGFHLSGEGAAGDAEDVYDADYDIDAIARDNMYVPNGGRQLEKSNSFRRIFYRVPNSIRMRTGDWEIGGNRNLFCGVTLPSDFSVSPPWLTQRELEADIAEEVELAGDLFLKSQITMSARFMWSLAAKMYSENFNYEKLSIAYKRLATVMSKQVPVVDASTQAVDLSHILGRFYRVHFHGGAPDELVGMEMVYRADSNEKLENFCEKLTETIRSILPEHAPLHIQLDDGRNESIDSQAQTTRTRLARTTPVEPVKVKVTPLKPLQKGANLARGTAEWFQAYTNFPVGGSDDTSRQTKWRPFSSGSGEETGSRELIPGRRSSTHGRSRSFCSARFFSSGSMSSISSLSRGFDVRLTVSAEDIRGGSAAKEDELIGVDLFCFVHPTKRSKSSRDWLKPPNGDICSKFLNKRYVGVDHSFPSCGSRQPVNFRAEVRICSLEAGLDAMCSWCSVLFRTAVATNGMAVLGGSLEQGIGNQAARIVSESIYKSRVNDIGMILLRAGAYTPDNQEGSVYGSFDRRLSEDEAKLLQKKVARSIVLFIEILHLLIGRNRDLLLEVIHFRKGPDDLTTDSCHRGPRSATSTPEPTGRHSRFSSIVSGMSSQGDYHMMPPSDFSAGGRGGTSTMSGNVNDRHEKAVAVHRELQRSFSSMVKSLYSNIQAVLGDETPKWLKAASNEFYFKSSNYRKTKLRMADELCFSPIERLQPIQSMDEEDGVPVAMVMSLDQSTLHSRDNSSETSFNEGSVRSGRARMIPSPMPNNEHTSLFQI